MRSAPQSRLSSAILRISAMVKEKRAPQRAEGGGGSAISKRV